MFEVVAARLANSGSVSPSAQFDFEACQTLMQGGSKTFFAASRLLHTACAARPLRCMRFVVWPTT